MEFNDHVILSQDWTYDRREIIRAVARVNPVGGTAIYDAIAQALPIAADRTPHQESAAGDLGRQ